MKLRAVLLFVMLLTASPLNAAEFGSWETPQNSTATAESSPGIPEQLIIQFQRWISPVDGARCSMTPTCSHYARQALRKHGTLLGTFITVDRLIHEGDPIEQQHPVILGDFIRYADHLEDNDFWLRPQPVTDQPVP